MLRTFTLIFFFFAASTMATAETIGNIEVASTCRINTSSNSWIFTNTGNSKIRVRYQVLPGGKLKNLWLNQGQTKTVSQNEKLGSTLEVTVDNSSIQLEGSEQVCPVEGIELTSVCSNNPNTRRWRVRNPNNFKVSATYEVYGKGVTGLIVLPKAGKAVEKWSGDGIFEYKFFETKDVGGANTLKLYFGDEQELTKASGNETCSLPENSVTAAAVCSDNEKRNLWEVYNTNTKKIFITRTDNGKNVSIPPATIELDGETEETIVVPGIRKIYTSRNTAEFSFSFGNDQLSPLYSLEADPCNPDPVEPVLADIYYLDAEAGVAFGTVYAVYLNDVSGEAKLEKVFNTTFSAHIAVTRDNSTMFLFGGGGLWKYDLINQELEQVAEIAIPDVVQVSINLDDELWVVSKTTEKAYNLNIETGVIIKSVQLDLDVTGGDIVFTSDAALLTGQAGLYTVDINTGITAKVSTLNKNVNGLAVLEQGRGDLIISTKDLNYFITIDPQTGAETNRYNAIYDGRSFSFEWGDMATGNLYPRFDGCQIFLADQDTETIYTVSSSIEDELAVASATFPYPTNYRDPHIALNLQGDKLYLMDSDQPNKYGYYDLNSFVYHEIGQLSGVGKITQLTFSPYGELFFSSNNSEEMYVFTNIESGTYESYGQIRIDNSNNILKIEGSDIAFDQDGTFYVASNQTSDDIYQVSGVKGHLLAVPVVDNLGKHITGLAVNENGDLLVSFYRSNNLMHINTNTFEKTNLAISGDISRNGYGDMSSACFNLLEFCDGYAEGVIEYNPGTLANGTGTPPQERMVATNSLGKPQETDVINFVSLGFGGDMVVELASPVYNFNKNGVYVDNEKSINYGDKSMADIVIVETSYGRRQSNCGPDQTKNYPERIRVLGAQELNGGQTQWVELSSSECRSSFIDVAPAIEAGLDYVKYLKLVDITNPQYFPGNADGFDVDGVIICPGEVVAAITGEGRDGSAIANARSLNEDAPYSEDFFNKAPNEAYQNGDNMVSIYPNPVVTNTLRINVNGEWDIAQYEIIDINGRIMTIGQVNRLNPTIRMNSLNSGLYVLQIKVAGLQESIKFTVKR